MTRLFNGVVMLDSPGGIGELSLDTPFSEWEFSNKVAGVLSELLKAENITVYYTNTGDTYNPIGDRIKRANFMHSMYQDSFLVAIRVNSRQDTGWGCCISGKLKSKALAAYFGYEADKMWKNKTYLMAIGKREEDYNTKDKRHQLLSQITCTSVITENFSSTNKRDRDYLNSVAGVNEVAVVHFKAIMDYITDTYK